MAALVNGTFSHNTQSVIALVASGTTEVKVQPGANAGNSRTFTQTCKYCTHCKKDWHCDSECTSLHPHLKKRDNRGGNGNDNSNNSGNSRGRGRGRGGRGGRGGGRGGNNNNTSNESKPATETPAAAAVVPESTAFSFMAYAEQPDSEATCLIANSQWLQSRTSQPLPSQKTMAQISSISTAAALSALWFIDSACTQHMVRDRSVFQTFTPFATLAKVNGVAGHIMAEGVGRIQIQCKGLGGKRTLVIDDVWYVPVSKFNLIFQGQLED